MKVLLWVGITAASGAGALLAATGVNVVRCSQTPYDPMQAACDQILTRRGVEDLIGAVLVIGAGTALAAMLGREDDPW